MFKLFFALKLGEINLEDFGEKWDTTSKIRFAMRIYEVLEILIAVYSKNLRTSIFDRLVSILPTSCGMSLKKYPYSPCLIVWGVIPLNLTRVMSALTFWDSTYAMTVAYMIGVSGFGI